MRAGFTSRQAFVLITLAAALLASIGVLAEYSHFVPEWVMLVLFLLDSSSMDIALSVPGKLLALLSA
ncbi:undecaprenyl-phosphate alpha-N-acetylglucosaminyltransferase [Escherichia coli]|nr:undecaprenyl-phosphate alpha-N-acetylglucosaminyltransferase [Escherichia coli]